VSAGAGNSSVMRNQHTDVNVVELAAVHQLLRDNLRLVVGEPRPE
jgi:hypothetical protein